MSAKPNTPETPQSPMQAQLQTLVTEVAGKLEILGGSFADLDKRVQDTLKGHADDIAKLSSTIDQSQQAALKRFHEIAAGHQAGRAYKGPFASRGEAATFGRLAAAIIRRDEAAYKAELEKAAIVSSKGPTGGYLMPELLLAGIIRNVEEYGVFERNCPAIPVDVMSGGSNKATSALTVYYPDFGVAGTVSTPGLAKTNFSLKRHVVAVEVDNWMLSSNLAASLGDWLATEISYALTLASDTNWFMGDGTSGYCGFTGLFKRTDLPTVTGDSGDDTFAEMIAKTTYYLGKMLGTAPLWVHRSSPRWFMHLINFFGFLGARDTAGQPVANILQSSSPTPFVLMGYPVEPVQVAPSATAVSTTFTLFGALARACRVYRHANAIEFKSSDQIKMLEGLTVMMADVPQDMTVADVNGLVGLKTAAS